MASVYVFHFIWFPLLMLLLLAAGDGNGYQGECPPSFDCGYLGNISFPFTTTERQDCGLLGIQNCHDTNKTKRIQLQDQGEWFEVIFVTQFPRNPYSTSHIRDRELYGFVESKSCRVFSYNYTVPPGFPFVSFRIYFNATLFRCNRTLHVSPPPYVNHYTRCPDYDLYYYNHFIPDKSSTLSSLTACTMVQLPIKDVPDTKDPFTFVTADIFIKVQLSDECVSCRYSRRGQCQLDSQQKFICAIANSYKKTGKKVLIVETVASFAGVAVLMVLACCFRRKIFPPAYLLFWKENPTHRIIEQFFKEHGPLPTARYNYSEVKKMTDSFRNKLGQGGYGSVYERKLHDGRVVAVKVLNESKGDEEEFINEVASISRTSHVNIVRLFGFCLDDSKRALIYEFIPNESVSIPQVMSKQPKCTKVYIRKRYKRATMGASRRVEELHQEEDVQQNENLGLTVGPTTP